MMTLNAWLNDVDGRQIGDGQCWTLAQDYTTRVVGPCSLVTSPSPHPGYACGVWDGYGSNGVEKYFDQKGVGSVALAGWLAIWKFGSAFAPESHIATVISDQGLSLTCMSQNPGVAHKMDIMPKVGLSGYLAPKNNAAQPIPGQREDNVGGSALDNISSQIAGIQAFITQITHLETTLSTPATWKRIGVYALGIVILITALVYLFKDEAMDAVNTITKAA